MYLFHHSPNSVGSAADQMPQNTPDQDLLSTHPAIFYTNQQVFKYFC